MSEENKKEEEEKPEAEESSPPKTSFKDYMKGFDAFGYNVVLNASKSSTTHNTLCGGVTTVII